MLKIEKWKSFNSNKSKELSLPILKFLCLLKRQIKYSLNWKKERLLLLKLLLKIIKNLTKSKKTQTQLILSRGPCFMYIADFVKWQQKFMNSMQKNISNFVANVNRN